MSCIFALWLLSSCNRSNGHTGEGELKGCNSDRSVVSNVENLVGEVKLVGDIVIIVTPETHYWPCNLPERLKTAGTNLTFTGKVLEIRPNERLAGTPIELTSASPLVK